MTIPSQFAFWLNLSERDGRGGVSSEPPAINRGRKRMMRLNMPLDPEAGDWTAGVWAARLRASPDAPGEPLASFAVEVGTPAGGLTPIYLELEAATTLPAADPVLGIAEVFLEVTYTIAGIEETIVSTRQLVSGVI
jgi:hypothetical protein